MDDISNVNELDVLMSSWMEIKKMSKSVQLQEKYPCSQK